MNEGRNAAFCWLALAAATLSGCNSAHAPSAATPTSVATELLHPPSTAQAKMPLVTPDPAARCVMSATNAKIPDAEIYAECLSGSRTLQHSRKPQPLRDDDAITAAVLQVYAAYALDRTQAKRSPRLQTKSARVSLPQARELIADARRQLTNLSVNGVSPAVRKRAYSARACLIDRDGPCLDEWARTQ